MASDSAKIENAHKATPRHPVPEFHEQQHMAIAGLPCQSSEDDLRTLMPMARPTDENTYAQILTWMKNRRKSELRWETGLPDARYTSPSRKCLFLSESGQKLLPTIHRRPHHSSYMYFYMYLVGTVAS